MPTMRQQDKKRQVKLRFGRSSSSPSAVVAKPVRTTKALPVKRKRIEKWFIRDSNQKEAEEDGKENNEKSPFEISKISPPLDPKNKLPTPTQSSQPSHSIHRGDDIAKKPHPSSSDDLSNSNTKAARQTSNNVQFGSTAPFGNSSYLQDSPSSSSSREGLGIIPVRTRQNRKGKVKAIVSDDETDKFQMPPQKKRKLKLESKRKAGTITKAKSPVRRRSARLAKIEYQIPSDDDSEEDIVATPFRNRRPRPSQFDKHSTIDLESEDSDDKRKTPSRIHARKSSLRRALSDTSTGTGESDMMEMSKSDKCMQEREELEEDLRDLQESGLELQTPRTKQSQRASWRHQLELLKQRRAGKPIDFTNDSLMSEDENDYDKDTIEDITDGEDEQVNQQELQIDVASKQEDSDDFIVDDEDGPLGAPAEHVELPFEFSRNSRKKTEEYFRDCIEWMVQKKFNPAFARDDIVYKTAFNKVDDIARGFAGSKFSSSVWRPDFVRALNARPNIIIRDAEKSERLDQFCRACGRSNHPATLIITFSGKAYDKESLEDISDSDDGSSSDQGSTQSHDSKGNSLPPEDREFFVGKHCKANAEMTHTLTHWRYHLNSWVMDWLRGEGHLTADKLVERENWSSRKRRKFATSVVESMHDSGQIKSLWRDFKVQINTAREAKAFSWPGR